MSYEIKFENTKVTNLNELLIHYRGNQTAVGEVIGINRGTIRRWVKDKVDVLVVERDGKLIPYVADRRNGHYKKEVSNEQAN